MRLVRQITLQLLLLAAGITVLLLAFKGQHIGQIWRSLTGANYLFVALSLAALLVAHFLRAVRWKMLIEPLGYNPQTLHCFLGVMTGYLANLAIPRIGEITRCSVLYKTDGAPVDKLIGTVITERAADLIMLVAILLTVSSFKASLVARFLGPLLHGPGPGRTALVLLFIAACTLILSRIKAVRTKIPTGLITLVDSVLTGIKSIAFVSHRVLFLTYSMAIWSLYALSTWLVFFSLAPTAGLTFSSSLFVLAAGSLGMIAPVQGGIGTYHYMVATALSYLGVASQDGLAYATLNHSSQIALFIVVGAVSILYLFLYSLRKKPITSL